MKFYFVIVVSRANMWGFGVIFAGIYMNWWVVVDVFWEKRSIERARVKSF